MKTAPLLICTLQVVTVHALSRACTVTLRSTIPIRFACVERRKTPVFVRSGVQKHVEFQVGLYCNYKSLLPAGSGTIAAEKQLPVPGHKNTAAGTWPQKYSRRYLAAKYSGQVPAAHKGPSAGSVYYRAADTAEG